MTIEEEYSLKHVASSGTTTITVGKSKLAHLTINGTASAVITILDGTNIVGVVTTAGVPVTLPYRGSIANGLALVITGTCDLTVGFSNH